MHRFMTFTADYEAFARTGNRGLNKGARGWICDRDDDQASLTKAKIAEVPITLHPDGRKAHAPHLKTFRDGWRTLRFFLLCSPRWLFLLPGFGAILLGLIWYGLALPGIKIFGATLDAHTLLFSSLSIMIGWQAVWFALISKTFAVHEGILPPDVRFKRLANIVDLERGLIFGAVGLICRD